VDFLVRKLPRLLDTTRQALAGFLGCEPGDLALVRNATSGVNAVLQSLSLARGDELVVTDHAYPACRNALDFVAGRAGAEVKVARVPFPLESADQFVEAVTAMVTPKTRLVMLDHVTSPSGLIVPLDHLLPELEGVEVLVDGAHAPGMIEVDLRTLNPTYYAGTCHKWMCAPKGSGFLYVRSDRQAIIRPTTISHGASLPGDSRFRAEFDWTGTDDPTGLLSVPEAIRYLGSLLPGGWPELMARNRRLALEARRSLCEALSIPPPSPDDLIGAMAALLLPGSAGRPRQTTAAVDPLQQGLLERYQIEVPVDPWTMAPLRLLRFSVQLYNRAEQFERLGAALAELL
jgi:isopenicillin-N epimerase